MLKLIKDNSIFYLIFVPIYIGSSFALSLAPVAIGFVGVIWFIFKKRYDYVILIFLLTLILANNRAPVFDGYEKLRIFFVGILFILSGFLLLKEKGIDRRVLYFIPYFTVGLISSFFFSPTMVGSIFKVFSYLIVVTSIFVLAKYLLRDQRFDLYEQLLLLIGISLLISLLGWLIYPALFRASGRLNGVFGNPNSLSLFCLLAFVFVDHFRVENSYFSNREILFLKIIIVLTLFLTGSRNGYVSLAIYFMFTIFLYRGFSGKSVAIILILGALIAFLQIETIANNIPFLKELIRPRTIATASGRSVVWPVAIAEIYRQPWLGGGFDYYSYYMVHFAEIHQLKGVFWYGVWNTYLAMLLDTGIIGLLAYIYFIYGVIRESARFLIIFPFLIAMIFSGMFEAWAVSSLNPITPFFLLFFTVISIHGSRYENFSTA